jgi:CheY-like chemotaxis protein
MMRRERKGNVLIVDNNERILWTFQEMLENAGFDTTTTWSGQEALRLMKSGKFHVLLVDDYLPDLHSHDFLERVTRLPVRPSIVVMFSDSLTPDDLQRYKALGVSSLVDKREPVRVCEEVSFCCAELPLVTEAVN